MRVQHRGIGLIEILIAVVIVSIGFLAAARMQVTGMRFSQSAYYQSQAYFMASDMIDRMRANIAGLRQGSYTDKTTSASATDPNCGFVTCTAAQIAVQDLHDWSAYLHPFDTVGSFVPTLPSSASTTAVGAINSLGDGVFAVSLTWSELVSGAEAPQTLVINFAAQN